VKYLITILIGTTLLAGCNTTQQEEVERMQMKIDELEQQQAEPEPPIQRKTSNVDQKIKCIEYGEENYHFMDLDDGYIDFSFYYSPILDTCVGEREEFGPKGMIKFGLFDMFKSGIGSWLLDYEYTSWCEGEDCLTQNEYREKKSKLLGE
tara:strand:- start:335 stop:784 length:450 start_codon:yes stop_codon:yes gene_type:complete